MERITIKELYKKPEEFDGKNITVAGWCRSLRASNAFGFVSINDGSCFDCLQVVIEAEKMANYDEIAGQNIGASFIAKGEFVLTPSAKQPFELKATEMTVEGTSTPDYPLQNKRHQWNFYVQLRIFVRGLTPLMLFFVFAPRQHLQFIVFSMNAVLCMCILL